MQVKISALPIRDTPLDTDLVPVSVGGNVYAIEYRHLKNAQPTPEPEPTSDIILMEIDAKFRVPLEGGEALDVTLDVMQSQNAQIKEE